MPRTVREALAVFIARLHEVKEFVELVEAVRKCSADRLLDLALLHRIADPRLGLVVADNGVDRARKFVVGKEEVDERTPGAVVSPAGVLRVLSLIHISEPTR